MSKCSIKLIDKFKKIENQHKELTKFKVNHQYVLYIYDNGDDNIIFDDLISCLSKIPSKMKVIEDYQYVSKCYILELISYYMENGIHKDVGSFKMKFG